MGIHGLTSLLKRFSPNSIRKVKLDEFKYKKIAIDTSLFIHKFLYSYNNIIHGFFLQIYHLRRRNIEPVYIFDGKPPTEKRNIIENRKRKQANLINRISGLELELKKLQDAQVSHISTDTTLIKVDDKDLSKDEIEKAQNDIKEKVKTLNRHVFKITGDDYRRLKRLFNLMNVRYCEAHGEADILCVKLEKENEVDACMTEDMDFLTHGSNLLLRDFNNKCNVVNVYDLNTILNDLDITPSQFTDLCILCGCDYTPKIRGIGTVGALKFIKKYGSIENIIEQLCQEQGRYRICNNFNYIKARELFDASNREFSYVAYHNKEINLNELKTFLLEHTKLTDKQIKNKFKKLY